MNILHNHIYKHQSLSKFSIPTGREVDAPKAQEGTLRVISLFVGLWFDIANCS